MAALRDVMREYDGRARQKEDYAGDLRKQIDELRQQLQRYGDALENDLSAGRERIATRVREALGYEKAFGEASRVLVAHLKDKPECRELLEEIGSIEPSDPSSADGATSDLRPL